MELIAIINHLNVYTKKLSIIKILGKSSEHLVMGKMISNLVIVNVINHENTY